MDVYDLQEKTPEVEGFPTAAAMHLQITHIVRWTLGRRKVGRKLWAVGAAQQRGAAAEAAHVQKCASLQRCRTYASDTYSRAFASARDDPQAFWSEAARDIHWSEPWSETLHVEDPVFPNW